MEVHPSLARTYTAPASTNPSHTRAPKSTSSSAHHKSQTNSSYSVFSQPSRASNSTQNTSASALWGNGPNGTTSQLSLPPPPPQNGPVSASNNVINRVADKSTSLFQFCRILRNRLMAVPHFEDDALWTESVDEERLADPVSLLWKTFRRGYPLLRIYNTLQPDNPIVIQRDKFTREDKREKAAVFEFLKACTGPLGFRQDECFIIGELFGEDTTGFVKVVRLVSRVVDILEQRGLIDTVRDDPDDVQPAAPTGAKKTQRQHIVDELVRTERTYVQHLELLHEFKRHVEQRNVIPGDAVHDIFLNLNALLDFQRRFLIRVEQVNSLPEPEQDWGHLFVNFDGGLRVYESYIANQRTCEEATMRNYEKLREAGGTPELQQIVESPTHLTAFLLKPFQRLSKYPLLLKELRDKGNLATDKRDSVTTALSVIQSILRDTNAFIATQERQAALDELLEAVEDWKNHRYEAFGDLLLFGAFSIQKGDITQADKEYKLYLFESMLLCCKDITHKRNRLMTGSNAPTSTAQGRRPKPRYALKGRIFLFNLEDVITMVKPGESYMCKLSWLANPGVESLSVRFPSEDTMNLWRDSLLERKRICKEEQKRLEMTRQQQQEILRARSSSEFNYLAEQGELENPYAQHDDDGFSSRQGSSESLVQAMHAHGSSSNLRVRSTGDAGPPVVGRAPPMRYPAGFTGAPLTLRTQQLHSGPPSADRGGNGASYFSPTMDSPMSSRTSSSSGMLPSSGMMPFPRQQTPSNQWLQEDSNRYTTPAPMTRTFASGLSNNDQRNARGPPHQSAPMHPAALAQTRNRSASSPDVQARPVGPPPPVPSVPSYLAGQTPVNRSQNNSPAYSNGGSTRTTISPNAKARQATGLREQTLADANVEYDNYYGKGHRASAQTQSSADTFSPAMPSAVSMSMDPGSMLSFKIKVMVPSEGATFMLVAASTITYESLRDRIDAKLVRCTNITLAKGNLRLQFMEDGELISIQTDEDVQTAFDMWRESQMHRDSVLSARLGEIEIYCTKAQG